MLRSIHRTALDRYCARVLEQCGAGLKESGRSPHERYLRLFRLLQEKDEDIATAFNDLRRSTAIQRLASMIALGAISDTELGQFSSATRDAATALAAVGEGPDAPPVGRRASGRPR